MTRTNDTLSTAIKVRLPAPMRDQLAELASAGVLGISDHVRLALAQYLANISKPPPNGFVDSDETR